MNTQYEKNSIYLAKTNYRLRLRGRTLRRELAVFITALAGVCAALYLVISSISI